MKNIGLKRICAYIVDMLFVTTLLTLIIQISYINPNYEEYLKYNNEYTNLILDDGSTNEEINQVSFDLAKNGVVYFVVEILIIAGYFVYFQKYTGGQTLGKKLLKLKVQNNDGTDISVKSLLIKAILLYGTIITIFNLLTIYFIDENTYYILNLITSNAAGLILWISAFMIIFKTDHKGLHDIISKSEVVNI